MKFASSLTAGSGQFLSFVVNVNVSMKPASLGQLVEFRWVSPIHCQHWCLLKSFSLRLDNLDTSPLFLSQGLYSARGFSAYWLWSLLTWNLFSAITPQFCGSSCERQI